MCFLRRMFFKNKISFIMMYLTITGNVFCIKYTAVKYSIIDNQNLDQSSLSTIVIKLLIKTNVVSCLKSCSLILECDAVTFTINDCKLIDIVKDTKLIQDNQVKLYLKDAKSRFKIVGN